MENVVAVQTSPTFGPWVIPHNLQTLAIHETARLHQLRIMRVITEFSTDNGRLDQTCEALRADNQHQGQRFVLLTSAHQLSVVCCRDFARIDQSLRICTFLESLSCTVHEALQYVTTVTPLCSQPIVNQFG